MRLPGALSRAPLFILVLTSALAQPSLGHAQGALSASALVTRGKPLSEWIVQADHYIPELRREAMKAIGALGPAALEALPVLVRATRDENEDVRYWAVDAIRRIGPPARTAAPALLVALANDSRPVQQGARAALEAIGAPAVPSLVPALTAPDPWLRANAAEALGVIGEPKSEAVAGLIRLLTDDSLWVRASAAWALGHLGREARRAAKPLGLALAEELRRDPVFSDPAGRVRVINLVYALGRLGKESEDHVPLIVSVFHDGDDSLRSTASVALAAIGSKAAEPMGQAVRQGPMPVRLAAARTLRLLGPEGKKAVGDLVKVLETTDELEGGHDLVIATADALGAMGKDAKAAKAVLEKQRSQSVTPDVVAALDRALRKVRLGA